MTASAQASSMAACARDSEYRPPDCLPPNWEFRGSRFSMPMPSFWRKATLRVASVPGQSFPVRFPSNSHRANQLVGDSQQPAPDRGRSRAALRTFPVQKSPPGYWASEHFVSGRLRRINFHSTSGRTWLRGAAETWTPSHFTMAIRWAPKLCGKRSRATSEPRARCTAKRSKS